MPQELFPVIEVPDIETGEDTGNHYGKSIYWDMESGDFTRDGAHKLFICAEKDTYIQWCYKTLFTERYTCLSYPDEIGVEMEEAMNHSTIEAIESRMERTITEALMVHPYTEYVRDFSFAMESDSVYCSFIVKGKELEEVILNVNKLG